VNTTTLRALDPTPPRPERPIGLPADALRFRVTVDTAHLGNPIVATGRLLASEASALARVVGDDEHFEITVASPSNPEDADAVEAWARWAVHNAGIRGTVERIEPARRSRKGGEDAAVGC